MIKKGDRVTIDGKTAMVQGWYGAGKHRVYQLDDGRTIFDIHILVERGDAVIETSVSRQSESSEHDRPSGADWDLGLGRHDED